MKFTTIAILLFACVALSLPAAAQHTYRVFFKDKGNLPFYQQSELYNQTAAIHSQRSKIRRQKVRDTDSLFSIEDAPVEPKYLTGLTNEGAEILLVLRWNNYAVVRIDSAGSEKLRTLPFVKSIQRTAQKIAKSKTKSPQISALPFQQDYSFPSVVSQDNCGGFRHGKALNQAQMMNIPFIHSLGFAGQQALITFLDSGFRWKTHQATKNAAVLAERDFIRQDDNTANDSLDVSSQDGHGSIVFSTVCGFLQDSIVGIAPMSSYLLAKTEDIASEKLIEEDNYAAAVEWSEALGTDIVTSSLSYSNFDSLEYSYTKEDFDGNTAISSRIVNQAVHRGVVCITAAGNDGPNGSTIGAPSDADSVITVSAWLPDASRPARFSSRGPIFGGKIKPDIGAQGVDVVCANHNTEFDLTSANGTSLAAPLIAGFAGVFFGAVPEAKPWEFRKALLASAYRPDSVEEIAGGKGIPDIKKALAYFGPAISPISQYRFENAQRIAVAVLSNDPILQVTAKIVANNEVQEYPMRRSDTTHYYYLDFPETLFDNKTLLCSIECRTERASRSMPYSTNGEFVFDSIYYNREMIPCGVDIAHLPKDRQSIAAASDHNAAAAAQFRLTETSAMIEIHGLGQANVEIYSIMGNLLRRKSHFLTNEGIEITVPIDDFPSGNYFAALKVQGSMKVFPFSLIR